MTNGVRIPLPCALAAFSDLVSKIKVPEVLRRYGYAVVGPADDWSESARWAESNRPDVAVLEFVGRNGDCLRLARMLAAADVPLVFYAAPRELQAVPAELKAIPFLAAPDGEYRVLKALSNLHNERLTRRFQQLDAY